MINNAGIALCPYSKTEDGFEMQIGANYFGHFVLTNLLLKALKEGAPSRVVTVSSVGHHFGKIDFEDINYEKRSYSKLAVYGQSKLANILFAKELHNKVKDCGITSYALNPGYVKTELGRHDFVSNISYSTFGFCMVELPFKGLRHQFIVQWKKDWRQSQVVISIIAD